MNKSEPLRLALEALEMSRRFVYADNRPQCDEAIDALRTALAQQDEPVQEPVQEPEGLDWRYTARIGYVVKPYTAPPQRKPETIDEAMQQPRAMAQAYENGYKAGVAHEREECAKVCEQYELARSATAAIRARGKQS